MFAVSVEPRGVVGQDLLHPAVRQVLERARVFGSRGCVSEIRQWEVILQVAITHLDGLKCVRNQVLLASAITHITA